MNVEDFLLARIAEDEVSARLAGEVESQSWFVDGPAEASGKHWVYATGEKFTHAEVADHIARHDPARALRECEAKRRIVEALISSGGPSAERREWLAREHPNAGQYAPPDWHEGQSYGLIEAVQNLAAVYADHPDYQPEWCP